VRKAQRCVFRNSEKFFKILVAFGQMLNHTQANYCMLSSLTRPGELFQITLTNPIRFYIILY